MYALADRLNKTVSEIAEMPYNEFMGWLIYLEAIKDG
tara:strand:+ start:1343 stop:1453 length:111 start_codon:yes stop_codon:yes gene_type:complete